MVESGALTEIETGVWLSEGPIVDFYGFPYPTRMVLIRLPDGSLWVWSPVALGPELQKAVDSLGPVRHLVSPNKLHHLYLDEWKEAYPEALLWGPPSTIRKRKDLAFQPALEEDAPADWEGAIETFMMRGSPFFEEIIFFHPASATAIVGDMSEHFSDDFMKTHWKGWKYRLGRRWGITEGCGHAPYELRLSWFFRKDAREKMQTLIARNPQRVVMAHGEWIRKDGAAFLAKAFDWLL